MWIAENWKDYEVLDTSKGEKLERWGDYTLVRRFCFGLSDWCLGVFTFSNSRVSSFRFHHD